jgi:hypothetical protein
MAISSLVPWNSVAQEADEIIKANTAIDLTAGEQRIAL